LSVTDVVVPRPLSHRLLIVLLVAIAVDLVLGHLAYQAVEVSLAGVLLHLFSSSGVYVAAGQQTVYFGLGSAHPLGLTMTPECTSAFLLVPLILVGALLIGSAIRCQLNRTASASNADPSENLTFGRSFKVQFIPPSVDVNDRPSRGTSFNVSGSIKNNAS